MTARTNNDTAASEPMGGGEAAAYQRLRAHLDVLRLGAAAGSLSTVLDAAPAEDLEVVEDRRRVPCSLCQIPRCDQHDATLSSITGSVCRLITVMPSGRS